MRSVDAFSRCVRSMRSVSLINDDDDDEDDDDDDDDDDDGRRTTITKTQC